MRGMSEPDDRDRPLTERHCRALPAGTAALGQEHAAALLEHTPGWELVDEGAAIRRRIRARDYLHTLALVNAVGWIAQAQDHHPEMMVGYDRLEIRYSTHTVDGLSENDFICAARINALL